MRETALGFADENPHHPSRACSLFLHGLVVERRFDRCRFNRAVIGDGYKIRGLGEYWRIIRFVGEHPEIGDILPSLAEALKDYFGETDRLLDLVQEAESPTVQETLYVIVDGSIEDLNRFDRDWWLDRAVAGLCVTIGKQ